MDRDSIKKKKNNGRPNISPDKIGQDNSSPKGPFYLSFSFRYMNKKIWDSNDNDDLAALSKRIFMLSSMTLDDIRQADRHGLGCEKITEAELNFSLPGGLTSDHAGSPISFRYGQGKKAMVGVRVDHVLYVLCVEHSFGDAYCHS